MRRRILPVEGTLQFNLGRKAALFADSIEQIDYSRCPYDRQSRDCDLWAQGWASVPAWQHAATKRSRE